MYTSIFNKVILPISEKLSGIHLNRYLDELKNQTHLNTEELVDLQKDKLSKLLLLALNSSPYYKDLKIDLTNDALRDLKKFPILTKSDIRNKALEMLTQPMSLLIKNGSSGSTGEQTHVYWSKEEQTINRATQLLWWHWAGYQFGNSILQTGINPHRPGIKKFKDIIFRTKYIQAFSHNEQEILTLLKGLQKRKLYFLAGYASSLFVLSQISIKYGLKVNMKSAIAWGDKLFPHYKKHITEAFNCKVYETYGSAEGLMMAAQKDLEFMYIMSPNVYIEILDDFGNEVPDGQMGNVIVTNLNGYAMPLIRYKVGDLAIKLPKEEYPELRELNLPILKKVIGRDTDIVKTKSGNYLVVHSFTGIFEHIPEIKQFCVIQRNLDGIVIQYIKGENFQDAVIEKIQTAILDSINEPFEIAFEAVDEIPNSPSGKPQLIISFIKN